MSDRLKKYSKSIKQLTKAPPNLRKLVLRKKLKDKEFVNCLCECAKNILQGNVPLTKAQKKSLSSRKTHLRKLSKKKTSLKQKKEIIQKGGFLGSLLAPIISVISGLFKQ